MKIEEALKKLREDKKRKFIQTVDLIINLQNFDARKSIINTFISIPNPSEKKICAFLTKKSILVDTITKESFVKYKELKDIKKLAKRYDFFIGSAPLMSNIATQFGRVLGPVGKMPSPQAGIMPQENDEAIKATVEKMKKVIKIRTKERSLKIAIGKEDLSDEQLKENIDSVIKSIEKLLPLKKDNIKNILVKFTMTKPIKILENTKK